MRASFKLLVSALLWSFVACAAGYAEQLSRPAALGQVGRFEFSARIANPAQLPKDTSREFLLMAGESGAIGAFGAVAAPISGLGFAGIVLVPFALIVAGSERKTWQTIVDAIKTIDLPKATLAALQRRAARTLPERSGQIARAEMIIKAFGVVESRPNQACFIANADLAVHVDGTEIMRANLRISDGGASPDAPPVQCASLETFAANGGRLLKDTAAEYAEVLAAMAIERIAGGGTR